MSTAELLKRCKKDLEMRLDIEKEYGIDVLSKDGMKIGITILEQYYMKETGISKQDLKKLGTKRYDIHLNDCILDLISFKDKKLSKFLEKLKSEIILGTRNVLKYDIRFDSAVYNIRTGGIHSVDKPTLIEPNEDELLIDADVVSYYPSMVIKHHFAPEHLGETFIKIYKRIFDDRVKAKKEGNKTVNETLKLSLNGTYGNFINEHS